MLDNTLVVWGGEFGRTPMVQGGNDGRDHHPNCFTMWLAGGGVKPGITSARATTSASTPSKTACTSTTCTPPSCTCSASTTRKLTYRFQGRDFRLTDVQRQCRAETAAPDRRSVSAEDFGNVFASLDQAAVDSVNRR